MTLDAKAVALPLIDALRGRLEQIAVHTSDRQRFEGFLRDFGWDASINDAQLAAVRQFFGVDATLAALGATAAALDSEDPDEVALIAQLLPAVVELVERIAAWKDGNRASLPPPLNGAGFWAGFPEDLINRLISEGLAHELGSLAEVLVLFGVVEHGEVDPPGSNRVAFQRTSIHWDRLGDMVSDPVAALQTSVGWGGNFQHAKVLDALDELFFAAGFPTRQRVPDESLLDLYYSAGNPARAQIREMVLPFLLEFGDGFADFAELGFKVLPIPPAGSPGAAPAGLAVLPVARGAVQGEPGVSDWSVALTADAIVDGAFRFELRPSGVDLVLAGGSSSVDVGLSLRGRFDPPALLIGAEGTHRVSLEGVFVAVEVKGRADSPEVVIRVGTGDGPQPPRLQFVFQAGEGDGFLTNIVGTEPQTIDVGGHLSFSNKSGIGISGSFGLQLQVPLHLQAGPVEFQSLNIGATASDGGGLAIPLGLDIKAELGPLDAVVSNIGASLKLTPKPAGSSPGLLGNLDLDWDFKPPNGVGLSLDAGIIRGGGFLYLDPDRGEYAGALEFSFADMVTLKAFGIITTQMPDGSDGFSLIAIISVEFNPGLQLGFGFTLIGVGGLLGLNRGASIDALVEGVRTGSINSIMFPSDVVANAPRIISDMRAFFPVEEETFLVGPMAKLGWGTPTLISLSLGVIIEIPGNIVIVGLLKVALPDAKVPLLVIQVAFMGAIEFDKKRGWFFAYLFESRVLFMPLEGGMGVLASFGNDANFVVTVGGFHPTYNPPALPFGNVTRIGISILHTPVARVRVEAYFAVTSNTVQFGARAELYFGLSIARVEGHLAFDVLFQFSPFYFIISISASLSVKLFGVGLFSVRFRGSLEGTSPWHIEGTGSISLLFWDVDVDFSHTWGDEKNTTLPPIAVMPLLAAEFEKVENWTARLGNTSSLLVALRSVDSSQELVLHPIGSLTITQRAIPLALTIDKVGSQRPSDANRFSLDVVTSGIEKRGKTFESFAIGQFRDLSDGEKLNAADFEQEEAGVELSITGTQTKSSFAVKRIARYEQIIIDNQFKRRVLSFVTLISGLFAHFLNNNLVSKSKLSAKSRFERNPVPQKIVVTPTSYVVANVADNTPFGGAPAEFASRASAQEFMQAEVSKNPNLAGALQVIRPHEVNTAA